MKTIDVLKKARALIAKGWTQSVGAADEYGLHVDIASFRACKFCASGAVCRAAGNDIPSRMLAMRSLARVVPDSARSRSRDATMRVIVFNDAKGRTRRQVLAAFDKAIKQEKAKANAR